MLGLHSPLFPFGSHFVPFGDILRGKPPSPYPVQEFRLLLAPVQGPQLVFGDFVIT